MAEQPDADRLITAAQVATILAVAKKTVWRMHAEGRPPAAVRIGPRTPRWRESDIRRFLQDAPSAR